jgi:hypothetical protein
MNNIDNNPKIPEIQNNSESNIEKTGANKYKPSERLVMVIRRENPGENIQGSEKGIEKRSVSVITVFETDKMIDFRKTFNALSSYSNAEEARPESPDAEDEEARPESPDIEESPFPEKYGKMPADVEKIASATASVSRSLYSIEGEVEMLREVERENGTGLTDDEKVRKNEIEKCLNSIYEYEKKIERTYEHKEEFERTPELTPEGMNPEFKKSVVELLQFESSELEKLFQKLHKLFPQWSPTIRLL